MRATDVSIANFKFYGKYFSDSGTSQCREIDPF